MTQDDSLDTPLVAHFVNDWNKKLYREGELTGEYGADWFWDNFQIKSAPLFKNACWYHIPKKWGSAVADMVNELKSTHPNIQFAQIKEKFCCLTVYFDNIQKDYAEDVYFIVEKCRERLRAEGVHPPKAPNRFRSE